MAADQEFILKLVNFLEKSMKETFDDRIDTLERKISQLEKEIQKLQLESELFNSLRTLIQKLTKP